MAAIVVATVGPQLKEVCAEASASLQEAAVNHPIDEDIKTAQVKVGYLATLIDLLTSDDGTAFAAAFTETGIEVPE